MSTLYYVFGKIRVNIGNKEDNFNYHLINNLDKTFYISDI